MVEITRKIFFYHAKFLKDGSVVNPELIFQRINNMPFSTSERYQELSDIKGRCMFVDAQSLPIKAQIGSRKMGDLPLIEKMGTRRGINLGPDEALYESTHFVVFEDNIIGMEYNKNAPRQGGLISYLENKAPDLIDEMEISHLIKKDISEDIRRAKHGGIVLLEFRAKRGAHAILEELSTGLGGALKALESTDPSIQDFEVVLGPEKHSREGIQLPFLDKLLDWIPRPEVKQDMEKVMIKAKNPEGEREDIDLLRHYVMATKKVVRQRDDLKSVDSLDMYAKIIDAYIELKSQIDEALWKT